MEADPYTDDYTDEISELVEEAHAIFNATTVSEVMDSLQYQTPKEVTPAPYPQQYHKAGAELILPFLFPLFAFAHASTEEAPKPRFLVVSAVPVFVEARYRKIDSWV